MGIIKIVMLRTYYSTCQLFSLSDQMLLIINYWIGFLGPLGFREFYGEIRLIV